MSYLNAIALLRDALPNSNIISKAKHPPYKDLVLRLFQTDEKLPFHYDDYEVYLHRSRDWLWRDAPRRKDLRLYEAVYHFNLYTYLSRFLRRWEADVWPDFSTGNGQIDLIIRHAGQPYALEVKSFRDAYYYQQALQQVPNYGQQLGLSTIALVLFVEGVDEANRQKYEVPYTAPSSGLRIEPLFVVMG